MFHRVNKNKLRKVIKKTRANKKVVYNEKGGRR